MIRQGFHLVPRRVPRGELFHKAASPCRVFSRVRPQDLFGARHSTHGEDQFQQGIILSINAVSATYDRFLGTCCANLDGGVAGLCLMRDVLMRQVALLS
jgi:hypothetical protein